MAVAVSCWLPVGVHTAGTWNPGDLFVGIDNEYFGGPAAPGRYLILDPQGTQKDSLTLDTTPSFTTGCSIDPTVQDGDLWTTSFTVGPVTHFLGTGLHDILSHIDLTADLSVPAPCPYADDPLTCTGGARSVVFAKDGTFYFGTAYGQSIGPVDGTTGQYLGPGHGKILHYNKQGQKLGEYVVDTTGFRGTDWLDLATDQETIYYTSVDDWAVTPPMIRRYNLRTHTQLADIPLINGFGNRISTRIWGFRILPPGDGTGGFLIATDLHVYQVDQNGLNVRDFINDDFAARVGQEYEEFLPITLSPDAKYFWTSSYAQADVATDPVTGDYLFDQDGNNLFNVTRPSAVFKFHIPTGTLQAGPINIGQVGDRVAADGLCVKEEYVAAVKQPDCTADPTNYLCHPVVNCSLPGSIGNPDCAVPGAPVITYPNPDGSTLVTGMVGTASAQVLAAPFGGDADTPASPGPIRFAASGLPGGLSIDAVTGQISGTVAANGTFNVVITATDQSNHRSATAPFTWMIGNSAPAIAAVPNQTSPLGLSIAPVALSATDLDSADTIVFQTDPSTPLPAGLTIQSTGSRSAKIVGTPQLNVYCPSGICLQATVKIQAIDVARSPLAASQTTSFVWTITNQAPSVPALTSATSSLTVHVGSAAAIQFTSTDPNHDLVNWSIQTTPSVPDFIINPATGLIGGFPVGLGPYSIKVVADDLHGGVSSTTVQVNVTNNRAPVCTSAAADPSLLWPPNHNFVPIAIKGVTDPDGGSLVFRIDSIVQDEPTFGSGDNGTGNTLTDGLIVGPQAQVRAERSGSGDGRVYAIGFTASDSSGASCSGAVTVGVPHDQGRSAVDSLVRYNSLVSAGPPLKGPSYNLPPTYVNPGNQTTRSGSAISLSTVAADPNLDVLTYSALGLPQGLVINPATGVVGGAPTTAGTSTVTLSVADPFGGLSSVRFSWTITANHPPVAAGDSRTISKGQSVTVQVLANDSDPDGDSLTVTSVQNPVYGSITRSGSTITYRPVSSFVGQDQFTYTISDGHGGTATGTIRIEVVAHTSGDNCDHERHRNGHFDGDGCSHDRCDRDRASHH